MDFLFLAVLLGLIPGIIAQKKGHGFLGWWLFGALLFIVALPMAIMLKPKFDDTKTLGGNVTSAVDARIRPFTVILIVVMVVAGVWYYIGGAHDAVVKEKKRHLAHEAQQFVQEVENTVANDAVRQYRIAARSGNAIDRCVHAGFVAAAYLQAENEAEYVKWKAVESKECRAAGIPLDESGAPYVSTWRSQPDDDGSTDLPPPKKPRKWQDSKGYWHFEDEATDEDNPNIVSGTNIHKWQDADGNWHFSNTAAGD